MPGMVRLPRHAGPVVTLLLAGSLLVGCGSEESSDDEPAHNMEGMDESSMSMDESEATPADEVDGEVASGDFTVLDTAPPGSEGVAGTAWLAQNQAGTTVTVRLSGLEPDTDYMGHLHVDPCATDGGGDHFQFERGGATTPPNEVHLGFTSDADGAGEATVTSDQQVGDRAPSVVVHPADSMDNRLACADFS